MSEPKRVLHIVGGMNRGGAETMIMNIYRALDRNVLQFDFITHRQDVCDYDEEIRRLGDASLRPEYWGVLSGDFCENIDKDD
ncbi:hypothetical protein BsIDN1_60340 [Bacillus safensis]|uniref:Uncharacterized protein n=1 Tax=Bacillus safensis TaxID=561879 RepID=A0A5S9MLB8_BACIA|nr:hypothetical protein BsIDN1_60340 [Bacillus safensis]